MRRSAIFLILCAAAVGCKSGPVLHVKAVPQSVPNGWQAIEEKQQGMSIGLPAGWKPGTGMAVDLGSALGMGADSMGQLDPNNPLSQMHTSMDEGINANEAKEAERLAKKGIYLSATDGSKSTIGETRTSFDVKRVNHDGPYSTADAVADELDAMRGFGPNDPKVVTLPIGSATRIDAEATTRGGDKLTHIHFVIVDGKSVYSLRFRSTNNPQAIQSVAQDVATTLRIVPSKG